MTPIAASVSAQLGKRTEASALVHAWIPGQYQELRELAARNYFPPIQWASEHEKLNMQLTAGLRLAALPSEVSFVSLLSDLRRQDLSEQVLTIRTLGWFGPSAIPGIPDLIEALQNNAVCVRREAAITLAIIGPLAKEALPALNTIADQAIVGYHANAAIEKTSDG